MIIGLRTKATLYARKSLVVKEGMRSLITPETVQGTRATGQRPYGIVKGIGWLWKKRFRAAQGQMKRIKQDPGRRNFDRQDDQARQASQHKARVAARHRPDQQGHKYSQREAVQQVAEAIACLSQQHYEGEK